MTSIYRIDVKVWATAYIRADSAEEATEIAKGLKQQGLEVSDAGGDIEISGLQYDDPELPDVSLSPAMTCHGPEDGDTAEDVND